ncbi:RNA polymerase sigma factor [Rhizobium sp. R86522]|uniref:RNA polymerase sigma factor n=1 Tax=Rhizobium sp. R86522 TaxID=3093861 RepID=UPI00366F970E
MSGKRIRSGVQMSFTFFVAAVGFGLRIHADGLFLDQLRSGDADALRLLIERHHAALVGLAQTIVKNRASAEDVAQETWLAVIANISRFEGKAALSTWIIAILLNKAKTCAKREGRYAPLAEETDLGSESEDLSASKFDASGHWVVEPRSFDGLNPERILAGRQLWNHVRDIIEQLPPAQKAVLIMRDVEGHDAAQTCKALELSPENQRVMLHRARTRIRNEIEALLLGKNTDHHASVKGML